MSSLVQFQPLIDSIREFIAQLRIRDAGKYNKDEQVLDLGHWLQYFAFDVICELTYSNQLGFVEQGGDVENIISILQRILDYTAIVSLINTLR